MDKVTESIKKNINYYLDLIDSIEKSEKVVSLDHLFPNFKEQNEKKKNSPFYVPIDEATLSRSIYEGYFFRNFFHHLDTVSLIKNIKNEELSQYLSETFFDNKNKIILLFIAYNQYSPYFYKESYLPCCLEQNNNFLEKKEILGSEINIIEVLTGNYYKKYQASWDKLNILFNVEDKNYIDTIFSCPNIQYYQSFRDFEQGSCYAQKINIDDLKNRPNVFKNIPWTMFNQYSHTLALRKALNSELKNENCLSDNLIYLQRIFYENLNTITYTIDNKTPSNFNSHISFPLKSSSIDSFRLNNRKMTTSDKLNLVREVLGSIPSCDKSFMFKMNDHVGIPSLLVNENNRIIYSLPYFEDSYTFLELTEAISKLPLKSLVKNYFKLVSNLSSCSYIELPNTEEFESTIIEFNGISISPLISVESLNRHSNEQNNCISRYWQHQIYFSDAMVFKVMNSCRKVIGSLAVHDDNGSDTVHFIQAYMKNNEEFSSFTYEKIIELVGVKNDEIIELYKQKKKLLKQNNIHSLALYTNQYVFNNELLSIRQKYIDSNSETFDSLSHSITELIDEEYSGENEEIDASSFYSLKNISNSLPYDFNVNDYFGIFITKSNVSYLNNFFLSSKETTRNIKEVVAYKKLDQIIEIDNPNFHIFKVHKSLLK